MEFTKSVPKVSIFFLLLPHLSWLHHEATVCNVRSSRHKEQLEVEAILSEATLGKFKAKFGDSVIFSDIAHD